MAIDTTNKKLALIEYRDVWQPAIPVSSDGIGQDDRQQLLWEYPGILWGVPAAVAFRRMIDVHTKTRIVDPKG